MFLLFFCKGRVGMNSSDRIHALSIRWEAMQTEIEAYLVRGKVNALIDSGPPQASPEVIAAALKAFDLKPGDIDLVLNTHGHLDHIGGNRDLKSAGPTEVWIHADDAVFLEDHARSFDFFYAPGIGENVQQKKAAFLKQMAPEIRPDRVLEDNENIDLGAGMELQVVHLPGHTPGSVGYYWEKEGILMAGDAVQGFGGLAGTLPIICDFSEYEKSISRLMTMPLESVLLCHPYRSAKLEPSRTRQGRDIRQYLSESLQVLQRLAEAIRYQSQKTPDGSLAAIGEGVIAELGEEMGYKKISELNAPQFSLGTVYWGLSQVTTKE